MSQFRYERIFAVHDKLVGLKDRVNDATVPIPDKEIAIVGAREKNQSNQNMIAKPDCCMAEASKETAHIPGYDVIWIAQIVRLLDVRLRVAVSNVSLLVVNRHRAPVLQKEDY